MNAEMSCKEDENWAASARKGQKRHFGDGDTPVEDVASSGKKVGEPRTSESESKRNDDLDVQDISSTNSWESADLGDDERKKKFLRLMGAGKKSHQGRFVIGKSNVKHVAAEDSQKVSEEIEKQYVDTWEKHTMSGFRGRHKGIGYREPTPPPQEPDPDSGSQNEPNPTQLGADSSHIQGSAEHQPRLSAPESGNSAYQGREDDRYRQYGNRDYGHHRASFTPMQSSRGHHHGDYGQHTRHNEYGLPKYGEPGYTRHNEYGKPSPGEYGQQRHSDQAKQLRSPSDYGQPRHSEYGQPRHSEYGQPRHSEYGQSTRHGEYGQSKPGYGQQQTQPSEYGPGEYGQSKPGYGQQQTRPCEYGQSKPAYGQQTRPREYSEHGQYGESKPSGYGQQTQSREYGHSEHGEYGQTKPYGQQARPSLYGQTKHGDYGQPQQTEYGPPKRGNGEYGQTQHGQYGSDSHRQYSSSQHSYRGRDSSQHHHDRGDHGNNTAHRSTTQPSSFNKQQMIHFTKSTDSHK